MQELIAIVVTTLIIAVWWFLFKMYTVCTPDGTVVKRFSSYQQALAYFRDHAKPGWLLYEGPDAIKKC